MSNETARVTNRYECGGCGKEFEMETEPSDAGMTSTCPHCGRVDNECVGTDEPEAEPFALRCIEVSAHVGEDLAYREVQLKENEEPDAPPHPAWREAKIEAKRRRGGKRGAWVAVSVPRSRLLAPSASVYSVAGSNAAVVEGSIWFLEADRAGAEARLRVAVREALMKYEALVRTTLLSEVGAFGKLKDR